MNTAAKVVWLLVAVVLLSGTVLFFYDGSEDEFVITDSTSKPKPRARKEVPLTAVNKTVGEVKSGSTPAVVEDEATPVSVTGKSATEKRWEQLFKEAEKKHAAETPSQKRAFRTGTEQLMSWIFTTELGAMPPPLPKIPIHDEARMAEILTSPNPVLESDDDLARNAKESVQLVKKELVRFVEEGGAVNEFFEYYHGELVKAHNEWIDCQKSVIKVIREEPEIAHEYIDAVNKRLNDKGIRSVKIPPPMTEFLDNFQKNDTIEGVN